MPQRRIRRQRQNRQQRRTAAARRRAEVGQAVENYDLPELQRARQLWQQQQYDAALELFEQTARQHPRNRLALTDTARAFGARYEIEKAQAYLDRLCELAPDDAEVQLLAGQSYRMIYRPDLAIQCLQRANELRPDDPIARLELSMLLERRGHLELAMAEVEAVSSLETCSPELRVIEGRLARRLGLHDRAATVLGRVTEDSEVFWGTRQQAGMELARSHEADADYEQSIAAAIQAKSIAKEHAKSKSIEVEQWVYGQWTGACHDIRSDDLARWRSELVDLPPQRLAMLTGPPRSGTTLLENILDAHPGLVSSDERDAFSRYITGAMTREGTKEETPIDILNRQTSAQLGMLRRQYVDYMQAAMGEPIDDRLHIDKNPSISTLIPGVLRLFPECKIILALRDPRDVVLSCYMTHMPLNSQSAPYLDFKSAAEHYARTMGAWFALRDQLSPQQYLEVHYEDVVADTEGQARRALAFLDLPWDDAVLRFQEHIAGKQVDSPTYEQVAKPIYSSSIGRWKRYEQHMGPALEALQPLVDTLGYV